MNNDAMVGANRELHRAKERLGRAHMSFTITLRVWSQNKTDENLLAHRLADAELLAAGRDFQDAQRRLTVTAVELFRAINAARVEGAVR